MENNNQQVISLLTEINENLKLVLEECKKTHKTPNLLDIFGGMNQNDEDDDEDDDDEDEDDDDDKDDDDDDEDDDEDNDIDDNVEESK